MKYDTYQKIGKITWKNLAVFISILIVNACTISQKEKIENPVLELSQIDSILNTLATINYSDLDPTYIAYSASDRSEYVSLLRGKSYFIIRGEQIFSPIVGKHTIQIFLCTDGYYARNLREPKANFKQYWLIDRKLLYAILDIINYLEQNGYDGNAFLVRESHRHPKYNGLKGGAKQSLHIQGKEADLVAEDVNNDGEINQKDKDILLKACQFVIGNKGGVGLYPTTMTVHIDVRGYSARW